MIVRTVTYERLHNLGNYENERVILVAEITEGEDVEVVFDALSEQASTILDVAPVFRPRLASSVRGDDDPF